MKIRSLYKKGVSLVTVLIFMMVATIAATATYKWLNSVGFTSADRMAIAEAKESSFAGIDAVRSWMTYHANDVGAIIRQYYDGSKKPVALTNLVRGVASSKQRFNVWLVGVDASRDTYKFTIVSTGTSRTDTKYSETAILNVRGLYKVKEPVKPTHKSLDFGYSYFGGSMEGSESAKNTSMLINGNWKGNPPIVDEDFVVTGNAELSGNNLSLGNHTCIGGDFTAVNSGINGNNLYVHGDALSFKGVLSGNAYFNGGLQIQNTDGLSAAGDVTVNGKYYTGQAVKNTLSGNFCMGSNAQLEFGQNHKMFSASKNVKFLNKQNPFNLGGSYSSEQTMLGGDGYHVYIDGFKHCSESHSNQCLNKNADYMRFPEAAGIDKLIKTKGKIVNSPTSDMDCDETIKDYCLGILGSKSSSNGCDNSDFKIDDMLTTAYLHFKQMNKTSCGNIKPEQGQGFNMQTLNSCYSNASESELYNGYLVVKLNIEQTTTIFSNPTGTLDGNFIFYTDAYLPSTTKFPPTTASSNVFVYLENGAETINTTAEGNIRNYFVYSKGNIKTLMNDAAPERKYTGSFYLTAESCAGIEKVVTAGINLSYNPSLVQDLLDNAVICDISEEGSCGTPVSTGDGETNTSGEDNVVGFDIHYVATAPQLSITLESQRKNKEPLYEDLAANEYTTVKPSVIAMPRIVYLDEEPKGKLQDYFNVLNLNGATETFNVANTVCMPSLSPTGVLYTGEKLTPGIYNCEYTPSKTEYGKNKFWIVVDGESSTKSQVMFSKKYERLLANSSVPKTVELVVDGKQSAPVTVTIKMTEIPTGWTVTKADIVNAVGDVDEDGSQLFTVTVEPNATTTIFSVSPNDEPAKDLISFSIEDLSANGRFGNPSTTTLQMTGEGFVNRRDITADFCDNGDHKEINDVACTDIVKRADCNENLTEGSVGEWITATCPSRYTVAQNETWQCSFAEASGIKLESTGNTSELCDLFIYDSTLTEYTDGGEYYLFASYKAKVFTFTLVLDGVESASSVKVYTTRDAVNVSDFDKSSVANPLTCRDSCVFDVPAGYHVLFEPVKYGDDFSKWVIGGKDTTDALLHVMATADTLVRAVFNMSDDHCFYSDFKDTKIWCNQDIADCIDKCESSGKKNSCSTQNGGKYTKSDWIVTRTNDNGNYTSPAKDGQNFLYYSNGKQNNSGNSSITYLLSRAEAGSHGKLTARFKTCAKQQDNKNLNSGFILRSSSKADEYAIINILGVENGGSYQMVARTCEGDGTGIKNANVGDCHEVVFPGISISSNNFPTTIFNAEIEVRGDKADIDLSYKENGVWKQSKATLNLGVAASVTPSDHFVGASLADDCFKLGNIGWEAYDWGEGQCTDIPQVSCSFAANYLGGVLPLNEPVTPWVSTTNWFSDPKDAFKLRSGCSISYHYNGCDLADGYSAGTCTQWIDGSTHCSGCSNMSDEGPYYVSGLTAEKMRSEKFAFTYAGVHGTPKSYQYDGATYEGAVRDVSVVVDCGDEALITRSCGRFAVGQLTQCAQSIGFRVSACDGNSSCVVDVVGGSANFRASTLIGEITGLPEGKGSGGAPVVVMVLKDVNGHSSQQIEISGNGRFSSDVNFYSDMQDFNPEQVASIEFTADYGFTLTKLQSDCPNSIGVYNCTAEFVGDRIEISSDIVNAQGATCKVDGVDNEYKLAEKDCPANGKFTIPAVKLQEMINTNSEDGRDYTFKVSIVSKENKNLVETCTTPAMTVNNTGLRCELSAGIEKLVPGSSIPLFYYAMSNCPPGGCEVELSLNNGNRVKRTYKKGGELDQWAAAGTLKAGTYIYKVEYAGSMCYKEFEISAENSGTMLQNCDIDVDKKIFTADLNLPNSGNSVLKLATTDYLGNPVGKAIQTTKKSSDKAYSQKLPDITTPGEYVFTLSVGTDPNAESCTVPYTVEDTSGDLPDDLGCYIEGDYFKTKVKNNTPYAMSVSLNCGPVGETWGNNVFDSKTWAVGSILDENAYATTRPTSDPTCKEFHLWYAGKVLCSVRAPGVEEHEGEVSCGIYDGDTKIAKGKKSSSYNFKISNIDPSWNSSYAVVSMAGSEIGGAQILDGAASISFTTSDEKNGSATYKATVNGVELCTLNFSWTNNGK